MSSLLAFVVMPFAPEFDEIYNLFIAEALVEAGYRVQRADDLGHQRNILQDVVAGLATADLVVADLTGANPNVYYEVGVAHGLGRRVVLLTQTIDELPFDLRSYRVILYNTHFAAIKSARIALAATAKGAADGSIQFGSPVADFRSSVGHSSIDSAVEEGELGLLDHLIEIEDGFGQLARLVETIGDKTVEISSKTTAFNDKVEALSSRPGGVTPKTFRDLLRAFAFSLIDFGKSLDDTTQQYDERLAIAKTSLEYIVTAQSPTNDDEIERLRGFVVALALLESQASGSRGSFSSLSDSMSQLPVMEKTFDGARKTAIARVRRFVQSIDATIEAVSTARAIGERILLRGHDGKDPAADV